MRYFKDTNGEVFAYESDDSQAELINAAVEAGWQEITGNWPPAVVVDPVAANTAAIQRELDRQAQVKGYDNIFTAISYAGSDVISDPLVAKFQAEGNAFKAWRSAVWAHAYSILAEVEAGSASMPTPEEAVAMMPPLALP